jgi:hypothetical protein
LIFDTDDLWEGHDRMDLLLELKAANPAFRMTAFCVQGLGSDSYWESLPDWIECATHGEFHPHPREAEHWSYDKAMEVLRAAPPRLQGGHKSPGWQVSDGMYKALTDLSWWIADHPENNSRRPHGLLAHVHGTGDHVHTHVQDWGSNGLSESWDYLLDRVGHATSFQLISEVVSPWGSDLTGKAPWP